VRIVDQHGELVAAETRDRVAGAHALLEPSRHGDEELVPDGVAERVVHDLEPVEIEEDERDPRRGLASPRRDVICARSRLELLREAGEQQRPVGQAGARVVERGVCPLPDLGLGALEQAGVVQRDRGQLGEPDDRLDLALAERP